MSRPKPFLHFKSSISGSIRAPKQSPSSWSTSARSAAVSPFSSQSHRLSANASRRTNSSRSNSNRRGTSPLARQSLRDKSQSSRVNETRVQKQQKDGPKQQQQQQQRQQAVQVVAVEEQQQQQKKEEAQDQSKPSAPSPAGEEEAAEAGGGGGTMVKMTASASRMAFAADGVRQTKAMSARPAGDPNTAEHLSRVAARARTATISVRRTQSAKSKRSTSRGSAAGSVHSAKKGGTAKLLEFGPLRFMAKESNKVKLVRQDSQRQPGLRAMLYGLTLKMEREEKLQKKLLRKRATSASNALVD